STDPHEANPMKLKHIALVLSATVTATITLLGPEPVFAQTPTAGAAASNAPAAEAPTAPGAGRRGGGGGGPVVVIPPLASAETVELAPPLDKTGNFKQAPKTSWRDVPGIEVK